VIAPDIASLRRAYDAAETRPTEVAEAVLARIAADRTEGIWIHRRDADDLLTEARALEAAPQRRRGALYGVPFAVKDSIDVAGVPTTAACPQYAYVARASSPVVDRLRAEGALYVGKTNLDQLATGLVGVRSPYGVPPNAFDARYVTGGSSSGSAAALARGHVSFAVATDTAGSGRIPATFNNLVGLKPSRGLLSLRGLVPACPSVDCISILAFTCEDAREVARVATAFDPDDPLSSRRANGFSWDDSAPHPDVRRLAIPREQDLVFVDDDQREPFDRACAELRAMGADLVPVDMTPFFEAGAMLYDGPWLAERLATFEDLVRTRPDVLLPVIRTILTGGERFGATEAFRAMHHLAALKRAIEPLWSRVTALVVPGAPSFPRIEDVLADPVQSNARLGRYTTFGNLLDLAAVAAPCGFRSDGLPAGAAFLGPWGRDSTLLSVAGQLHARTSATIGALSAPLPPARQRTVGVAPGVHLLAVVGAHLSGQPLNHELTDRGGLFVRAARTSPRYRLFALADTVPVKPGLVRVGDGDGVAIEVEIWALPADAVGSFLTGVRTPLCLGTVELSDGRAVHGFLCEAWAIASARDISMFGGWRAYLGK
jgi:allophanate hydrolase